MRGRLSLENASIVDLRPPCARSIHPVSYPRTARPPPGGSSFCSRFIRGVARTSLDGAIQSHLLRSFLLLRITRNNAHEWIASSLGPVWPGDRPIQRNLAGDQWRYLISLLAAHRQIRSDDERDCWNARAGNIDAMNRCGRSAKYVLASGLSLLAVDGVAIAADI